VSRSRGLKQVIGTLIWDATSGAHDLRRALRPIGLRINQSWLGGKVGAVRLAGGHVARLACVDRNYLSFELHWKGWRYFSPYSILAFRELLRDARTFLDIGANVGYYSLTAAGEREDLRVVAFEPNPTNFETLAANSALNGSRIKCIHAAVSDQCGTATLHVPASDMSASLESAFNPAVAETVNVRTWAVDDFLAENPLPTPMVFKVIIEGHEPAFLRGARKTLQAHRPDMLMAVHAPHDADSERLLRDCGYSFWQVLESGIVPEPHLRPCKQGPRFYLEHLVTTRPEEQVQLLGDRLKPRFAEIPIHDTNLWRPDLEAKDAVFTKQ
jgi:FkbM family methyltransferase